MSETIDYNDMRHRFDESFEEFLSGKFDEPEKTDRWTGYVIDNDDPEELGRVKVLIIGKYDNIPEAAIPWAVPDIGYLGSIAGNFVIPETGTILRGYFDHDDIQKPVFDSVAFNFANKLKHKADISSSEYPHKMILMQTDQGEYLTLNRANGDLEFRHRSGTLITVWANGGVNITTGELNVDEPSDINIYCPDGNINVQSDSGNILLETTTGDVTVNSLAGRVYLGNNMAKTLVNNLPNCLVTGAPHAVGNTNVLC